MNKHTMNAFLEELGDIVKEADVIQDVGNPIQTTPSFKSRMMDTLGPGAVNIGMGLLYDMGSGRDVALDLSRLAKGVTSPSELAKGMGANAKNYFIGSKGQGAWRVLPLLGTGFTALEAADALKKEDPTGQRRSRADRITRVLGRVAGGVLGAGMGQTASGITGMVGEAMGKGLGAGIDYLTGYDPNKG